MYSESDSLRTDLPLPSPYGYPIPRSARVRVLNAAYRLRGETYALPISGDLTTQANATRRDRDHGIRLLGQRTGIVWPDVVPDKSGE